MGKRIDIVYECPKCMNKVDLTRVQVYCLDMLCAFCHTPMKTTHIEINNGEVKTERRS